MSNDLDENRAALGFKRIFRGLASLPEKMKSFSTKDEISEARSELHEAMETLLKKAATEKRDLSDEEGQAYDFASDLYDKLDDRFNAILRQKEEDEKMASLGYVLNTEGGMGRYRAASGSAVATASGVPAAERRSFKGMFPGTPLSKGKFEDFRDFMSSFFSGRYDPRLTELRTQLEGTGTAGGFTVPSAYLAPLIDGSLEGEIVRPNATIFPMTNSGELHVPAFSSANHSNLFGGFELKWQGEASTATPQTAAFRDLVLRPRKASLYCNASREILADGLNFQSSLIAAMQKSISFGLDRAFITGDGVGEPTGILNAPSTIKVNRASAGTIGYADLVNCYARLAPGFMQNACWIVSTDAVPRLMQIADSGNHLVWSPGYFGSISQPVPTTLFGKKVYISEKNPTLGSAGDVIFCDLSQYGIAIRQDAVIESTNAAYFTSDLTTFRLILRIDASSLWDTEISPVNGGNTLSWCVALDA